MPKRHLYASLILVLFLGWGTVGELSAQSNKPKDKENLTPVDIKSRRTRPVPVGDTTGYSLVGDVVLYHNGAVITCDSVIRYNEGRMSCYGNVIIKKDSTYIYGDQVDYDRDLGEARVYSPLIKVLSGQSTLYTYNLVFNTAENIGRYYGGGTFTNGENTMEAERGYFYADLDEMVGVESVEMENETYKMKSDSVKYNSESEIAQYYTRSITWKDDGEIISSDNGEYHNKEQRYIFRSKAYLLGEQQEMWADTVDYFERVNYIELRHRAQIRDEEHKSIIFGNYGNYDDAKGDTFLTRDPAYVSYGDADGDGVGDTVYMRSDSMYLYLIDSLGYCTLTRPDSATLAEELAAKAQAIIDKRIADSMEVVKAERAKFVADSTAAAKKAYDAHLLDSLYRLRSEFVAMELNDSLVMVQKSVEATIERLENPPVDTLAQRDTLPVVNDTPEVATTDSLATEQTDTLPKKNSRDRIMLGLRNVNIYRADFQGICDSMLMFSADSTAQLHVNTVMWNELNQVVGERADIYTHKQKPYRALFTGGKPLMSSELDTAHYNQVAGKSIEALFEDGVMYRTNIDGNAQTYYYMVDEADGAMMGYLVAESSDMTFYIEDNTVYGIMYRGDPVYTIYPMDKIPASQPQRMPEFKWYIDQKPTIEHIMGYWTIAPSEREYYMGLKPPQFPITYSILRHRDALVAGGGWADRDEDISDMAKEFIERVEMKQD